MLSYDAYQFQLAFISYGLAMVQVNYTPAYRELYENAQLALIEKNVASRRLGTHMASNH